MRAHRALRWTVAATALALSLAACGTEHADTQRESPPTTNPSKATSPLVVRSVYASDASPVVAAGTTTATGSLPSAPSAPGRTYTLSAGRAASQQVQALVTALGLHGTPTYASDGWVLRSGGQVLTVSPRAGNRFTLTSLNGGVPVPDVAPTSSPSPAATSAAKKALTAVLAAIGRSDDPVTATGSVATASHRVDGLLAVGFGTSVTVQADGSVYAASGWLGRPSQHQLFALTGAAQALKRLPGQAPGEMHPDLCVRTSSGADCAGRARHVTGATLGLMLTEDGNDTDLLAPAWLLQVAGQSAPLAVIAVTPQLLKVQAGESAPSRTN